MTFYELQRLTAREVELVVRNKSKQIIECITVEESQSLCAHRLFDYKVIDRLYNHSNRRMLVTLDYDGK